MHRYIEMIEREQFREGIPDFKPGDRVRVNVRITEGEKVRQQAFEGDVIRICHGGSRKTFTVRKISYGVGVERIFPYDCPNVSSVDVIRTGKVRRAKLHYLRKLSGKAARLKEQYRIVGIRKKPRTIPGIDEEKPATPASETALKAADEQATTDTAAENAETQE